MSRVRRWVQAACWIAALSMGMPAHASEDAHVLVLGHISDDPNAHYAQLKPLLDYVVPRMRTVGITEGRILMARDAQQMASYLRRNRVDWVTETANTATLTTSQPASADAAGHCSRSAAVAITGRAASNSRCGQCHGTCRRSVMVDC